MTKEELLKELKFWKDNNRDKERAHAEADTALLRFIDDKEIEAAYDAIDKWYS